MHTTFRLTATVECMRDCPYSKHGNRDDPKDALLNADLVISKANRLLDNLHRAPPSILGNMVCGIVPLKDCIFLRNQSACMGVHNQQQSIYNSTCRLNLLHVRKNSENALPHTRALSCTYYVLILAFVAKYLFTDVSRLTMKRLLFDKMENVTH
ncbi:hypothetical protein TNCV_2632531 [Trichonephila clavipes]|nr:hypothetical protein TNCV_2632531 [Trichonephila clavipes]